MKIVSIFLTAIILISMNIKAENNTADNSNLVLLPVKEDPTIAVKIMFNAGSQYDPEGKEGLAALTAYLISEGSTGKNSYEKILELLYPIAAWYDVSPAVETSTFTGRTHKDNLEVYYPLMIDAILNPAFKEEDFKRVKENMLNYLNTTLKYSSDEELGKAVLYNEIFEGTGYGHITAGTISGLESITIDDVKNFYKRFYNRNNFILGVGGGYDDAFVQRLLTDLNTLPAGEPVSVGKPQYDEISGKNVTIVEKQASATAISIGYPIDVVRGDDDWYALAVANSWLGEHRNSSSHLYQVIREARGLNYGDYSYIENFPNGGSRQMPPTNYPRKQQIFEIWIRPVPNETKHFVLRAALRELQMLIDNGLTKEQFELTRNFLSKYVLHYAPSTMDRLGYAIDDKFYGLEKGHLDKFSEMLSNLTLEDVNNAVRKHLNYDNMAIAFITNEAEALKQALINETESPIEYSTPKAAEVMEEDKSIINYPLNIKEADISVIPVEDLFK